MKGGLFAMGCLASVGLSPRLAADVNLPKRFPSGNYLITTSEMLLDKDKFEVKK